MKITAAQKRAVLYFTAPLILIIAVCSVTSITDPLWYLKETESWKLQSVAQDYFNLFIISPLLILSCFFIFKKNYQWIYIWAGAMFYTVYAFLIYCFDIHFSSLFILYCFALGLSFYASLFFVMKLSHADNLYIRNERNINRLTFIYFVAIFTIFYFSWIYSDLSFLTAETIPDFSEMGLLTNPVHVIDLSVFLPLVLICALQLKKASRFGLHFTPVILSFFILMDLTIAVLNWQMCRLDNNGSYLLAILMIVLALFSLILLLRFITPLKNRKQNIPL